IRIAAQYSAHVAQIPAVHSDEEIVARIVVSPQLAGGVALTGDAVGSQFAPGWRIDGVAQLLGAGGGGGNLKFPRQVRPQHQIFHDKLRHGRAADVAMAHEQYFGQFSHTPSWASASLVV